jgi:hypothetical protein
LGILKNLFNSIQGKHVVIAGYLYALIAGAFCLSGEVRIAWFVLVVLGGVNWYLPLLSRSKTFSNWFDPQYWPTFVLLAVAALVAGPHSRIVVGSVFMVYDGMYFLQNY